MLLQGFNEAVLTAKVFGQQPTFKSVVGFTAIELLVTLSIVSIIAAVGMPALNRFVADGRITGAAAAMVTAVNQARSEAISNGRDVSLYAVSAKSMGSSNTSPDIGSITSANAWSDGFRLLQRTRSTPGGALSTAASQTTLLNQTFFGYSPTSNTSIVAKRVTAGSNNGAVDTNQITFNRNGQMIEESTGSVIANDVQIRVCDGGRTGEKGRRIVINNRGNVKNYPPSDSHYDNPCT